MAEDLLPTIVPGMVGLKNKKSGKVSNHFPVDAREILTISPGEYELVDNGAAQASRLNANPLHALEADRRLIHSEITGVEGQVLVAMTPEQAEEWRKASEATGTTKSDGAAQGAADAKAPAAPAPAPAKAASAAK